MGMLKAWREAVTRRAVGAVADAVEAVGKELKARAEAVAARESAAATARMAEALKDMQRRGHWAARHDAERPQLDA